MITLQKIEEKHLTDLYNVIYSSETPEWSKYNAPYFNDFKLIDLEIPSYLKIIMNIT